MATIGAINIEEVKGDVVRIKERVNKIEKNEMRVHASFAGIVVGLFGILYGVSFNSWWATAVGITTFVVLLVNVWIASARHKL